MPFHLGARLHAWWHGLWRPTEAAETEARYWETARLFAKIGIESDTGRAALIAAIAEEACERLSIPPRHEQATVADHLVTALFDFDGLFVLPRIDDWYTKRTIAQWWDTHSDCSSPSCAAEASRAIVGSQFRCTALKPSLATRSIAASSTSSAPA